MTYLPLSLIGDCNNWSDEIDVVGGSGYFCCRLELQIAVVHSDCRPIKN